MTIEVIWWKYTKKLAVNKILTAVLLWMSLLIGQNSLAMASCPLTAKMSLSRRISTLWIAVTSMVFSSTTGCTTITNRWPVPLKTLLMSGLTFSNAPLFFLLYAAISVLLIARVWKRCFTIWLLGHSKMRKPMVFPKSGFSIKITSTKKKMRTC